MSIEAMKQALEALDGLSEPYDVLKAQHALRTAIAEAESVEPVAWMFTDVEGTEFFEEREDWGGKWTPLYTTPPAAQSCPYIRSTAEGTHHCALSQRHPLTDEQISQIIAQCKITLVNYCSDEKQQEFARAIEAAHGITAEKGQA